MAGPYSVELIQTDPPDSPTPGCGHYAGELRGFDTSTEALSAGISRLGGPPPPDALCFDPGWIERAHEANDREQEEKS